MNFACKTGIRCGLSTKIACVPSRHCSNTDVITLQCRSYSNSNSNLTYNKGLGSLPLTSSYKRYDTIYVIHDKANKHYVYAVKK